MQSFIFSNKPAVRFGRHVAFWGLFYIYTLVNDLPALDVKLLAQAKTYAVVDHEVRLYISLFSVSVYVSIYFILPTYLRLRKPLFLFSAVFVLIVLAVVAAYFIARFDCRSQQLDCSFWDLFDMAVQRGIWELVSVTGAAVIIKILKDYALRQRESEALIIENARNNIQLLKMRLHPRILFASLRTIHQDLEAGIQHAPDMILKLADLLSYLLYDAERKEVPLHQELKMVQTYGDLKKLEYKEKLRLHFDITGDTHSYEIMPGLFLPLLEASLAPAELVKNSLSVFVVIAVVDAVLSFTITAQGDGDPFINQEIIRQTLDGTRKKLELAHNPRYELKTALTPDSFMVQLKLELKKIIPQQQGIPFEQHVFHKFS